jgi:cell division topological specificity factor MinE
VAAAAALRVPSAGATRVTPGRSTGEAVDLNSLSLMEKVAFAWSVFFPPKEADHARNDAKKRLRMILVADRCALSPQSMSDMKSEIVRVVSEFVVVDQGEAVDVNMTNDEEMGTIYSVSIPVKRIKPAVRCVQH